MSTVLTSGLRAHCICEGSIGSMFGMLECVMEIASFLIMVLLVVAYRVLHMRRVQERIIYTAQQKVASSRSRNVQLGTKELRQSVLRAYFDAHPGVTPNMVIEWFERVQRSELWERPWPLVQELWAPAGCDKCLLLAVPDTDQVPGWEGVFVVGRAVPTGKGWIAEPSFVRYLQHKDGRILRTALDGDVLRHEIADRAHDWRRITNEARADIISS